MVHRTRRMQIIWSEKWKGSLHDDFRTLLGFGWCEEESLFGFQFHGSHDRLRLDKNKITVSDFQSMDLKTKLELMKHTDSY